MQEKGNVFNIQHYSLHDGPGIRTIVFLKGCPLRCRWCCNPESQNTFSELSYYDDYCIGKKACGGDCQRKCMEQAIAFSTEGKAVINRQKCNNCLVCVDACPANAFKSEGIERSVKDILDIVENDSIFYRKRSGGLTISGGEPLLQGEFLISLLQEAKKLRFTTAIETCGYGDYQVLKEAAGYLDMILFDIKSMDEKKHVQYTGCSNQKILANFETLCRDFPTLPKLVRTPVIPCFNDTPEELLAIEVFLKDKLKVTHEKLPYHCFGVGKYKALGRQYPMEFFSNTIGS
jgi:pyruvate formate lyase activating enzyme